MDMRLEDSAGDKGIPLKPDVVNADLGSLGDVEDNLGMARLAALDEIATREGPTLFTQSFDDLATGNLVGDGVERDPLADAGDLVEVILGEMPSPDIFDRLHNAGVIPDHEDDT